MTQPDRVATGFETLADDYLKVYRYEDAAKTYDDLLTHFGGVIDKADLDNIKDDYGVIKLLRGVPPQTLSMKWPMHLQTERSPIGSIDAELAVNHVKAPWILDTGANFSVVSASFAKRLGVQPSTGEAQTKGTVNGAENRLHVGILHEIKIGTAIVHNVVLLILEDENLRITTGVKESYQINAVLGFPVSKALGSATFIRDGGFEAGSRVDPSIPAARMFMNKFTPLLESSVSGRKMLFSFDTGANESQFSVRYYRDFPDQFKRLTQSSTEIVGAGGIKKSKVYILPKATLGIANNEVTLHGVSVLPFAVGTDFDDAYGNLGRDIVAGFESFTLDFRRMRFVLGRKVAASR